MAPDVCGIWVQYFIFVICFTNFFVIFLLPIIMFAILADTKV